MQFNSRQQQQEFGVRMEAKLKNMTLSWNNDLEKWYPIALEALDYSSIRTLQIPSSEYPTLFEKETHGLNVNVVAALANNLELRRPAEMGMTATEFKDILALNDIIGKQWEALVEPSRKEVEKEMEQEEKERKRKAEASNEPPNMQKVD